MLESAGFAMSAQTVAELRGMDLAAHTLQVRERVLLVGRDDLAADDALDARLTELGIEHDHIKVPGWSAMMAEHQFTVVPHVALATIVDWLHRGQTLFPAGRNTHSALEKESVSIFSGKNLICEEPCRFGDDDRLFGILSRADADPDKPAILLFNAGAVHHVGPNRIYVALAREMAALGFACLRFDLEGLGDSVAREGRRENHPYPDTAVEDVRSAIACLRERHGYSRFIALGLCSGAHTAFHTGLAIEGEEIAELVLINPLTFYWQEGMSLETVNNFSDAQQYRKSARDPARWMKLLRGEVNLRRLLEVVLAQSKAKAQALAGSACEALLPSRAPRLAQDLRRLIAMKRAVTFLIAEGDPGRDVLMAGARHTATRAIASGHIKLDMIPGGDHTFSQSRPRQRLLDTLSSHLQHHLHSPAASARP